MHMNMLRLIFIGIAALAVIIILFIRNQKDKKKVVDQLKNDFTQKKAGDEDIGVEEKI